MQGIRRLALAAGERLSVLVEPLVRRPALLTAVSLLLLVPAALLLGLVAVTMAQRLTFPLDLDWLEGSQIYHAYRVLHGLPLYRLETSGFLPHPYPPAHPLLLAAVGAVFGLDYVSARAVSIVAFAGAALVLVHQVWRHWPGGRSRAAMALVAAGYFAATYRMTEGWFDAARVDSLALAFAVLAAAPLASKRLGWRAILLSAVFASLAMYTKQTTVFFALGICLMVALRDRKKGLILAAAMAALCTAALLALQYRTDGAFLPWLLNTRHHKIHPDNFLTGPWLIITWAPFIGLLPLLVRRGRSSARAALWLGLFLAAVPASLLPLAKRGGALNSLMPIWLLAGPVVLILLADLARRSGEAARRGLVAAVLIFQAAYFPFFFFDPARARPGAEGRRQAESLNRAVAALDGGVICPLYPFVPVRNGQPTPQASWLAHGDAMWADMPGVSSASYAGWLRRVRPKWILLTDDTVEQEAEVRRMIGARYTLDRELAAPRWDGRWQSNPLPRWLYRRLDGAGAAPGGPKSRGSKAGAEAAR